MFDFDPAKSEANKEKHGVDFVEAQSVWADGNRLEIRSRKASAEDRWLMIGAVRGKLWTVIVTYRADRVRIVSCRRARRDEERLYEQAR